MPESGADQANAGNGLGYTRAGVAITDSRLLELEALAEEFRRVGITSDGKSALTQFPSHRQLCAADRGGRAACPPGRSGGRFI